jgi:hypothetical protein
VPKKASSPALYELFRTTRSERSSGAVVPRAQPSAEEEVQPQDSVPGAWLEPGRALRVSVGVALVTGAVALILLIGTYLIGYQRGGTVTQSRLENDLAAHIDANRTHAAIQDPLHTRQADLSPKLAVRPAPTSTSGAPVAMGAMGPVESDPRDAGVNYFVLAAYPRASAVQLAEFCRQRGLEAYVVKDNNTRYFKVIVVPGYSAGERQSPAIKALESRILEVGREWDLGGRKDNLSGYYPEKHRG